MPSAHERVLPQSMTGHTFWMFACSLLLWAAPTPGYAEAPLCDSDWGERYIAVEVGERDNDDKPLRSYNPSKPFEPYDLVGDRYLFGRKGRTYETVGRFTDRKEGEEALKTIYTEKTYLYQEGFTPYLASLGPYLVNDFSTCKADRNNPATLPSYWLLEKEKVLLAGTATDCTRGQITKKVTVMSCDGKKNLLTDSVSAPCDSGRITTCIHSLAPGVFLFQHYYSTAGEGTTLKLRVYDTAKKKKLKSMDWVNSGGPDAEILGVEDVDKDGVPEIVRSTAGGGAPSSILQWKGGKFVEVKSP